MKRFLLGLLMVGSVALAAAPMANALTGPQQFCGHNYAIQVQGDEPVTASSAAATTPLNYIAGIGVLKFGALNSAGPGECTVGGEMIYNDNDAETFTGGPQNCPYFQSSDGVPCFDGMNHITGFTAGGPNGSNTIVMSVDFPFVINSTDTTLPFVFTVFTTGGGATLVGNSNIPLGGTGPGQTAGNPDPCPPIPGIGESASGCGPFAPAVTNADQQTQGAPPGTALGPILSFTAQRQSVSASLNPVPTVYGQAPYIGNTATLVPGFGGNSNDLTASAQATQADEPTGTYGLSSGSLTIFGNGYAFGSLTFNENDDVGNTTGLPNYDCDFEQQSLQAFGDGTGNSRSLLYDEFFSGSGAVIPTPYCRNADAALQANQSCTAAATPFTCCTGVGTGSCSTQYNFQCTGSGAPYACCTGAGKGSCNAPVGALFVTSTVQWGSLDQNTYVIVTGVASPALLQGNLLPPGLIATGVALQESSAPGTLTAKISPAAQVDSVGPYPVTKGSPITLTNTSEGACTVGAAVIPTGSNVGSSTTGTSSPVCSVTLSSPGAVSEGDGPQNPNPWNVNCTCTAGPISNSSCTGSGTPFGCCTGVKAGNCVAESDSFAIGLAPQPAPPAFLIGPTAAGECPLAATQTNPIAFTCKN